MNFKAIIPLVSFCIFLIFNNQKAQAQITKKDSLSPIIVSEIGFEQQDSVNFLVWIDIYYLCTDSNKKTQPELELYGANNPGNYAITYKTDSLRVTKAVSVVSADSANACNVITASFPNLDRYRYYYTVAPKKDSILRAHGTIRLGFYSKKRPVDITTARYPDRSHYNYAEIDLNYTHNLKSPKIKLSPRAFVACAQSYRTTFSAEENVDGDSFSYVWDCPLESKNVAIQLIGKDISCAYPFTVFYPGTVKAPFCLPFGTRNNPNPIGLCFDEFSGDLNCYPIDCNQKAVFVVKVTKWRKDTSGSYIPIAKIRRDVVLEVKNTQGNRSPGLSNVGNYETCENEKLCLEIGTNDIRWVDPYTGQLGKLDTVKISITHNLKGATYSIDSNILPTATFCWTPPMGSASNKPYQILVEAQDNAVDMIGKISRSVFIKVKPKTTGKTSISQLSCNDYVLQTDTNIVSNFRQVNRYVISNGSEKLVPKHTAYFLKSKINSSKVDKDTLRFFTSGKYIIVTQFNNSPNNCSILQYDTVDVNISNSQKKWLPADTIICAKSISVVKIKNDTNLLSSALWFGTTTKNNFLLNMDSLKALDSVSKSAARVFFPTSTFDTALVVFFRDTTGCMFLDSIKVQKAIEPLLDFQLKERICFGDSAAYSIKFSPGTWRNNEVKKDTISTNKYILQWSFNAKLQTDTMPTYVKEQGAYKLQVMDSLGCVATDSTFLSINKPLKSRLEDKLHCYTDPDLTKNAIIDTFDGIRNTSKITWQGTSSVDEHTNVKYAKMTISASEAGISCSVSKNIEVNVRDFKITETKKSKYVCMIDSQVNLNEYRTFERPPYLTFAWESTAFDILENDSLANIYLDSASTYLFSLTLTDTALGCESRFPLNIIVNNPQLPRYDQYALCQSMDSVHLVDFMIRPNWNANGNKYWCTNCPNEDIYKNDWLHIGPPIYPQLPDGHQDTLLFAFYDEQKGCKAVDKMPIIISANPNMVLRDSVYACNEYEQMDLETLSPHFIGNKGWEIVQDKRFRNITDFDSSLKQKFEDPSYFYLSSTKFSPSALPFFPLPFKFRSIVFEQNCLLQKELLLFTDKNQELEIISPQSDICGDIEAIPLTLAGTSYSPYWNLDKNNDAISQDTFFPIKLLGDNLLILSVRVTSQAGCNYRTKKEIKVDSPPQFYPNPFNEQCADSQRVYIWPNVFNINFGQIMAVQTMDTLSDIYRKQNGMIEMWTYSSNSDKTILYTVEVQGENGCNEKSYTFDGFVKLNASPEVTIAAANDPLCEDAPLEFTTLIRNFLSTDGFFYDWKDAQGHLGVNNTQRIRLKAGEHSLFVKVKSPKGCESTASSHFVVHPKPKAHFSVIPENGSVFYPRYLFSNNSTIADSSPLYYTWNVYKNGFWEKFSELTNPFLVLDKIDTNFYVKLLASSNMCHDSMNVSLSLIPEHKVFIPNTFTPNKSGPAENEGFRALVWNVKTYRLSVYNRWNELLFTTNNPNLKWDGFSNGKLCLQGIYFYELKVTDYNDRPFSYKGFFNLLTY